ncbi:Rrf2 family transcriptional regulator [Cohnella thailandensis]|uniref:Rrf2 family transcriptional regulator n=1 Tax=Cohnella thailandensis TaxID=557557 RepID=A0A841SX53_9BACL|nr:Rrf2 family transcriptional regulator [Cohnella thailandensis]MBB6634420.1 Rrf2 family transcriptional regulator [Cohnella thailandensis]MBP1972080.1 DNA-binding IscR family transcriptional regulator [Cohnella thailandensis]
MAISSRFSVAAHILTLIHQSEGTRITSEYIASSVNTNPVVIRRILGMLSKAGLVRTSAGVAGATLARPLGEITMLDVYRAVQPEQEELFSMHEHPNPACPVGRNIQASLDGVFTGAQRALEAELASVTMEQVSLDVASRA